jgi:hypothetical protein
MGLSPGVMAQLRIIVNRPDAWVMDALMSLRTDGLFLRREALDMGVNDKDLRNSVRAKELVRVRQGAYVASGVWAEADDVAQHLLRARAVLLTHDGKVALSHVSGAIAHGVRVWGADLSRVHVVRLDGQTGRSTHDVVHHSRGWSVEDVVDTSNLTVLSPAQCLVGAATTSSIESGVVAVDSAYDLGLVTEDELRTVVGRSHRWPGTSRLQITMRLAEPGAQSVGESRMRYLCWKGHLPKPVLQYQVRDHDGKLIGEFDGRVKYGRLLKSGEAPGDAVFREKVREDRLRELTGWLVVRLVWADLEQPHATLERLRRVLLRRTR